MSHQHDLSFEWTNTGFYTVASTLVISVIAFGSGHILQRITGTDFNEADWIITIASVPISFTVIFFVVCATTGTLAYRRFEDAVKKRGGFRTWAELLPKLNAGEGTLIVQLLSFGPTLGIRWRIWWTPDEVPVTALSSAVKPVCKPGEQPFADECLHRYAHQKSGNGLLTITDISPPDEVYILPQPLGVLAVPFQQLFPKLHVVVLPIIFEQP